MTIKIYDKIRVIDDYLNYLNIKNNKVSVMIEQNTIDGIISDNANNFFNKERSELMLQIEAILNLKASLN